MTFHRHDLGSVKLYPSGESGQFTWIIGYAETFFPCYDDIGADSCTHESYMGVSCFYIHYPAVQSLSESIADRLTPPLSCVEILIIVIKHSFEPKVQAKENNLLIWQLSMW